MKILLLLPAALLLGACAAPRAPLQPGLGISGIVEAKAADTRAKTATTKARSGTARASDAAKGASTSAAATKTALDAAKAIAVTPLPEKADERAVMMKALEGNLEQAIKANREVEEKLVRVEADLLATTQALEEAILSQGAKDAAIAQIEASARMADTRYSEALTQNTQLAGENRNLVAENKIQHGKASYWRNIVLGVGGVATLAGIGLALIKFHLLGF